MKVINIDIKDIRIIHKLYLNEKAVIIEREINSWEEANIERKNNSHGKVGVVTTLWLDHWFGSCN